MEVLTALTMIVVCYALVDFFGDKFTAYKQEDIKETTIYAVLTVASALGMIIWLGNFLWVQPWRIGVPAGGGVVVYHKDVPPELSESEKIEKELEDMSDHKRWMFINDRVDMVITDLDEVENTNGDLLAEITRLKTTIRDLQEQVIRNENSLDKHLMNTVPDKEGERHIRYQPIRGSNP